MRKTRSRKIITAPEAAPLSRRILGQLYPVPSFPPTIRELGDALGKSPTTIRYHLGRLRAQGLVAWEPTIGRTLTITDAGITAITENGDPS